MKTIENFQQALEYANHLGFGCKPGFPGWIIQAQSNLCKITDLLEKAAGGVYPYKVRCKFYISEEGFRFPWLSKFTVVGQNGKQEVDLISHR